VATIGDDFITDELLAVYLAVVDDGVAVNSVTAREEEDRRREGCCFLPGLLTGAGPRRGAATLLGDAMLLLRPGIFFWFHSGSERLRGSSLLRRSWYWAIFWRKSAFSWPAASLSCRAKSTKVAKRKKTLVLQGINYRHICI
jgi:hypothetical protein